MAQGVLRWDVQRYAIQGFYFVVYGYAPGIYTMWYVPYDFRSSSIVLISYICREDCHRAVKGYKNAKYKKLTTFAEAMAWMILKGQKLGQEEPVGAVRSAVLGTCGLVRVCPPNQKTSHRTIWSQLQTHLDVTWCQPYEISHLTT